VRRTLLSAVALFAVYACLSLLNDPAGYLGTDTGGKVATLRAVDARGGGLDPDVGYWAERWDPKGTLHPLYYTNHIGDRWVNVTTLPALYASLPLYRIAGYRGALAVPMLGAVAVALAAAALARRLGARDGGRLAFWVVGLASPITIYAIDFWEHTLGVALMAWAVVVLVDLSRRAKSPPWALVAGGLFGAAATMRTEALVYGLVATALACLALFRRSPMRAVAVGLLVAAALVVPLTLNAAVERSVVGQSMRADRAQGTVQTSGDVTPGERVREAAVTAIAATSDGSPASMTLGALVAVLVALAVIRRSLPAALAAGALVLARTAAGLDFVPGMLVATPPAAVGVAVAWKRGRVGHYITLVAVASLPLVWAFQFAGGAGPQWGGRYILLSGFLLGVVGIVAIADAPVAIRNSVVALSVLVTALGMAWMVQRTHEIARGARQLEARSQPVLISGVGHLVREGGAVHDLRRWLTAVNDADLRRAADVADAAGAARIGVVDVPGHPPPLRLGRYCRAAAAGSSRVRWLAGSPLAVWDYRLDPGLGQPNTCSPTE